MKNPKYNIYLYYIYMEDNLLTISLIILSVILIILFGSLLFIYIINNKELRIPRFGQTKEQADKYYDRYPERFSKKWRKSDK